MYVTTWKAVFCKWPTQNEWNKLQEWLGITIYSVRTRSGVTAWWGDVNSIWCSEEKGVIPALKAKRQQAFMLQPSGCLRQRCVLLTGAHGCCPQAEGRSGGHPSHRKQCGRYGVIVTWQGLSKRVKTGKAQCPCPEVERQAAKSPCMLKRLRKKWHLAPRSEQDGHAETRVYAHNLERTVRAAVFLSGAELPSSQPLKGSRWCPSQDRGSWWRREWIFHTIYLCHCYYKVSAPTSVRVRRNEKTELQRANGGGSKKNIRSYRGWAKAFMSACQRKR